jgi:hypothetical protein
MFSSAEVIHDPYALKKSGKTEFTLNLTCDVGPLHPAAFVKSTDSATQ